MKKRIKSCTDVEVTGLEPAMVAALMVGVQVTGAAVVVAITTLTQGCVVVVDGPAVVKRDAPMVVLPDDTITLDEDSKETQ